MLKLRKGAWVSLSREMEFEKAARELYEMGLASTASQTWTEARSSGGENSDLTLKTAILRP